jgi:hypothetical protein
VRRIVVDPGRVTVLGGGHDVPPSTGPGAWLRRNRLRLAATIAVVEAIAIALFVHGTSRLALLALAALLLVFHFWLAPRVRSYTVRQISWTLAFAQALIAILSVLLFVVGFLVALLVFVVLVAVVVAGIAALLGDRR